MDLATYYFFPGKMQHGKNKKSKKERKPGSQDSFGWMSKFCCVC